MGWFLINLCKAGRLLPRRQDIPLRLYDDSDDDNFDAYDYEYSDTYRMSHEVRQYLESFVTPELCVVSHAWLSQEHPDPSGSMLKELSQHCAVYPGFFGVFFDFCSLPQHDRSLSSATETQTCHLDTQPCEMNWKSSSSDEH